MNYTRYKNAEPLQESLNVIKIKISQEYNVAKIMFLYSLIFIVNCDEPHYPHKGKQYIPKEISTCLTNLMPIKGQKKAYMTKCITN